MCCFFTGIPVRHREARSKNAVSRTNGSLGLSKRQDSLRFLECTKNLRRDHFGRPPEIVSIATAVSLTLGARHQSPKSTNGSVNLVPFRSAHLFLLSVRYTVCVHFSPIAPWHHAICLLYLYLRLARHCFWYPMHCWIVVLCCANPLLYDCFYLPCCSKKIGDCHSNRHSNHRITYGRDALCDPGTRHQPNHPECTINRHMFTQY